MWMPCRGEYLWMVRLVRWGPGAGAGIVIITPEEIRVEHSFRLGFKASNNEAKYEALLAKLRAVLNLGV